MNDLKPYICTQCGSPINREKMICEYCGTQFVKEDNVIRVVAYHPGVHTLGASVALEKEMVALSPKEASEYAIRHMAQKFADGIAQFMDVRIMDMPLANEVVFESRLRVIDSGYRFGMSGCGADMRGEQNGLNQQTGFD